MERTEFSPEDMPLNESESRGSLKEVLRWLDSTPSPEQLERRRKAVAAITRLRDEIGPIDLTLADLLGEEDDPRIVWRMFHGTWWTRQWL